jgi:transposase
MVAILRPTGEVIAKPFKIFHEKSDLKSLASRLKKLDGETKIIMEATGHYHKPILEWLNNEGLRVHVVNPILIKQYGDNSVRKAKTDKKDAMKIARYGLSYWDELPEFSSTDEVREKLLFHSRQFGLYIKTQTALKENLISLADQVFPFVNKFFDSPQRDDGHQKWVDFLHEFWHIDCVFKLSEAKFESKYRKWCKANGYQFSLENFKEIRSTAAKNVATLPKNSDTKFLIQTAAKQLQQIAATVESYRAAMIALAKQLPEWDCVIEMYGVRETTGAQIMAEVGDVRRFHSRKAIVSFAGLDPEVNESGKSKPNSAQISKKGSPQLRKALFQVMQSLIKLKPSENKIYDFMCKKRAEGKEYFVCTTAGCTKFLRIYYAVVKEFLNANDT